MVDSKNSVRSIVVRQRVSPRRSSRRGASLVEMAFVLPVFLLLVFALVEFGHALMVMNILTTVAKDAAHEGSFDGTSTADVVAFANQRLAAVLGEDKATVTVKNAATFESSDTDGATVDVTALSAVELNDLESRDLFLVHIEVPYNAVALLPPFWVDSITFRGDSIMRRE